MAKKYVDGVLMDTTEDENAQIKIDGDNYKQELANFETEKTNTQNARASGKQKLIDLGLTEAEIKALIGV